MKILAIVRFNKGIAYVLDRKPELVYKKVGNIIYGTDGLVYKCYQYEVDHYAKAFGGGKFDITLETGEVINCNGQWWDAGHRKVEKIIGARLGHLTARSIDDLRRCYVYTGYSVDIVKWQEFVSEYDLPVYAYYDYEKILKYDELWRKIYKLKRDKESLISGIKKKHKALKDAQEIDCPYLRDRRS